jgi:two-component system NarL family sensor kinase
MLSRARSRNWSHWYVDGLVKRRNMEISLSMVPTDFPRLTNDVETAIFRVVQESLTNVYRHAAAEAARVEIVKQPEKVLIRVRDYGKGIPEELCRSSTGHGLGIGIGGMRERLRQFGGELIVSCAEPGTLVEAKIPAL